MRYLTAITVSVVFASLAACGDSNGSGSSAGAMREAREAASSLCEKAATCGGMSSSEMSECSQMMGAITQYVVDADSFERCIMAKSCDDLTSDTEDVFEACANIDWDSFRCMGERELEYCNNKGVCLTIDCQDGCEFAAESGIVGTPGGSLVDVGCGMSDDPDHGDHDKCRCYFR